MLPKDRICQMFFSSIIIVHVSRNGMQQTLSINYMIYSLDSDPSSNHSVRWSGQFFSWLVSDWPSVRRLTACSDNRRSLLSVDRLPGRMTDISMLHVNIYKKNSPGQKWLQHNISKYFVMQDISNNICVFKNYYLQ